MKDFIKFTLATVVGIIITGIIISILSAMTIAGIIMASQSKTDVKENSVMKLDLSGTITEQAQEDPLEFILHDDYETMGLKEILAAIEKAGSIDNIKGIYLKAGYLSTTPAALQEIRNALLEFKKTGKFIVAYGDVYTQGNYYLCSVADKLMLNPQGVVNWSGMASQPIFYKDLLDKLGIEMQIFKVGTYKSAVEPYIANTMSEANREQVSVYLNSIWDELLEGISQSRQITKDSLNAYANRMMALCATPDYLQIGMVDTLVYQNEVKNYLQTLLSIGKNQEINVLTLKDMTNVNDTPTNILSENEIAVYYAEGGITDAANDNDGINAETVCQDLRSLAQNDNIKAVVLRVNSPGGSAYASEQIWHEVVSLKEKKPVIVSMGGYAASGGYYISCAANKIVAEPTTLTGSIGIFGMVPCMQKLLNDKIGVHSDVVKTNTYADMGNLFRPFSLEERTLMQAEINRGYDLFITRCADGRNMSKEAIEKIAEGRVWTGATAKELGLVDALGGIDTAIKIAAQTANISDYTISSYPEPEEFFISLFQEKKDHYIQSKLKEHLGEFYPCMKFIKELKQQNRVQARIPYELNLNL